MRHSAILCVLMILATAEAVSYVAIALTNSASIIDALHALIGCGDQTIR